MYLFRPLYYVHEVMCERGDNKEESISSLYLDYLTKAGFDASSLDIRPGDDSA